MILQILKLVYNLLQTNSFNDVSLNSGILKITGTQAGQGDFCITVKLIENNEHLQIVVETLSSR